MGLTSRGGVVPLNMSADVAGPMARTVADAVAVFQVVAGYDPADSVTVASRERPLPNYAASLVRDGLRGARIGVLRQAYERPSLDAEVRDAAHLENLIRALKVDATVEAVERVRGLEPDHGAARLPGQPEHGQGILPLEHTRH